MQVIIAYFTKIRKILWQNYATQDHREKFLVACESFQSLSKLLGKSMNFLRWVREIGILLFSVVL